MGCGNSSPMVEEGQQQPAKSVSGKLSGKLDGAGIGGSSNELAVSAVDSNSCNIPAVPAAGTGAEENEPLSKSASTRRRRLSVVQGGAGQAPIAPAASGAMSERDSDPSNAAAVAKARSRASRARRLSHIAHGPDGQPAAMPEDVAALAADGRRSMESDGRRSIDALGTPSSPADPPHAVSSDSPSMHLHVACMSRAGKEPGFRKTNQDNCFAFEKYIADGQSLFGAMDGHGPNGHLVSGFIKQHLPIMLVNRLAAPGADAGQSLKNGFVEVDAALTASRVDCEYSGTTAVVAYLKGRTMTTAWVGDSRGVLGVQAPGETKITSRDLTIDHKPTAPEEKERILRSNGRVERLVDETGEEMGPYRVWLQSAWIPGLAMSRALGDVLAHQVGVSSEPETTVTELDDTHKFMILASDGVWEFVSSQDAVDIIAKHDSAEEGCRQLVEEAHQRWLVEEDGVVDDITAVVVKFQPQ